MRTKTAEIERAQRVARARAHNDASTSLAHARDAAGLAIAQLECDRASCAILDAARIARASIVHAIDAIDAPLRASER